jgi:hypothetical protein
MQVVSPFNGLNVDYRIIALIVGIIVSFQIFIDTTDYNVAIITNTFALALTLLVVSGGITLSYRYKGSRVFGRSFIFLTLGFASVAIGKLLVLSGVNTYPPIDTVFFFGLYVFLSIHMYINICEFGRGFGFKNFLILSPIVLGLISVFYVITYMNYGHSDFNLHYCGASVIGTSILAALALRGFHAVKKIPLGRSWRLLTVGVVILTLNDIWFHYEDTLGIYNDTHYVNLLFYASYMIIAYALYIHKKAV